MRIDQAVRTGDCPNASTLADEFEVSPKTVRRDIVFMRDQLQAPLEYDPLRYGYYYRDPTYRLPFLQLSEGELVALLLAERLVRQYRGTPFEGDLRHAFAKLAEMLPESVSVRIDAAADCLSVLPDSRIDYETGVFAALARAALGRRRVEMVYWTAGRDEVSSRVFDPYSLMLADEGWYAVGHCHRRGEILVFAAQRVREIRETGETFDRPSGFRLEDYMGGSFRTVRGEGRHRVALWFSREHAGRIAERTWHPTQQIERDPDGGLVVRFEVNDLREVRRWVMSWGSSCVALEPEELRDAIVGELEAMAERYRPNEPENHDRGRSARSGKCHP